MKKLLELKNDKQRLAFLNDYTNKVVEKLGKKVKKIWLIK